MEDQNNVFENTKLAGLCLNVITSNFERFMYARDRNDTVPERHFEFLQRAYAKHLFEKLAPTEHCSKHVDFLLNEYLKEVDLNLLHSSCDMNVIVERLKSIGHTITTLVLSGSFTTNMIVDLSRWLSNVQSLTFHNILVTEEVLNSIEEHCKMLETLKVMHHNLVTHVTVLNMPSAETIEVFIFSGNTYSSDDVLLDLICHLRKVKSLTFEGGYVKDKTLKNIGLYCSSLEILILANCFNITDIGINYLCPVEHDGSIRKNNKLKYLDVYDTCITTLGIAFILKHCPNITTLQHNDVLTAIYNIHADDIKNNCVEMAEPYKITELIIEHEERFMDINFFKMCPTLCPYVTKLTVAQITSQSQIDACTGFTKLKEVYFSFALNSASLSSFVEACGKILEILRIRDGNISVESLLKFCPKLTKLHLENTRFEPLKEFENDTQGYAFQHLEFLSLEGMNLGQDIVNKSVNFLLLSSPNLKILNLLYADSLNLDFVNSIAEYDCMRILREVEVSFSDIKFSAAKKLLIAAPNLTVCLMQHCDLTFEEYIELQQLRPSLKFDWRSDSSDYSDYGNVYDGYDDVLDHDYDYFDYDSDNDYDDYPDIGTYDDDVDVYI